MTLSTLTILSKYRFIWLFVALLGAPACKSSIPEPATEAPAAAETVLTGSTLIAEVSATALTDRVQGVPLAGALVRYPIQVYRLTYRTKTPEGTETTASGAVLVPVGAGPLPVLSYQHGTLQPRSEPQAPSYYARGSDVWSVISVLASTGYVVSAPDYLGYGASKALPHPYEHAASLASSSADMLRATREFCQQQKVNINQKNFLLGYSEGGYATMALHKLLEEKYATALPVTASAPGAGAYHKSAFARYILGATQPLSFLSTYVWVLRTYDRIYALNRPFSFYYQQPYAAQLQADPFADVPSQQAQLFAASFREAVLGNNDAPLAAALAANDIYDWKPRAPLALFHGTADDYVPFFNSQDAYDTMQQRGATQVQLRPIQGGNHFTSVTAYTLGAYAFISQF
ncbi:alpha/beta fold hydrolase [Hymenobacter sp. BT683]|uniref:Alpha/beta fold hydrolase n=1 Tax=Hymenobacter jeongseonensis TaxID=2791027 RepID=A0ABS0IFL4_9BACT|nr:alpha/beta fold hydrolase [Hymenobacter jeongseonensis]MBF9237142.1 alpha/beta fold hydrolase [Hymenobacter jeongseonensis]